MTKAILAFHQGWTDIVNQISLINFYYTKYNFLELYIKKSSKYFIDFYCKNLENVKIVYTDVHSVDFCNIKKNDEFKNYDILLHGFLDNCRVDKYKNSFIKNKNIEYIRSFYLSYNIPLEVKIDFFNFERDFEWEEYEYQNFIKNYGDNYILYHSDQSSPGGDTGIDVYSVLQEKKIKLVDLNGLFENPFVSIKILQNAKELHLSDSMWGSLCYLMECKYNLFKESKIFFYPFKTRCGGQFCDDKSRKFYNQPPQDEFLLMNPKNWSVVKL